MDATIGGATGATIGEAITSLTGGSSVSTKAGPLGVGESFGPRYHIIRLLGAGGMGAVYQAWDAELSVAVALKVIRVDKERAASTDAEKRFKQELLLARQVTHKHVVRIHDLGEIDGIKYLTMPYVQGHDLASVLRKGGRLPVATAMRLARQIAAGMQAAHEAGVVHRDLKPANIMVSGVGDERQALIMDFGISASADSTATEVVVGTLEYMAPEQAKGVADARSDVYAFGLILYEMLTGPRTIADATPQARVDAMQQRFADGMVPIRVLDASIPQPLGAFVMKCLVVDPAERFPTVTELNAALATLDDVGELIPTPTRFTKRIVAAAAVLMVSLVGATWWLTHTSTPPKPHDPVTVVIADFQNTTGDPAFDRTLEQTIRRGLEGVGFINAYDRSRIRSALGIAPPNKLDEEAARKLAVGEGLGIALAGSIAPQGNGYQLAVKATQPRTGKVIASVTGRASSKDQVLGTVAKLATTVRKALGDETTASNQALTVTNIAGGSLDAVSRYAAGVEAQAGGKSLDALQNFAKAVELDPKFGLAYQGLAGASRNLGRLQDAETYAAESLRYLDGMTERERLSTRANYYRQTGDYQQCVKEYGDLIARYPVDAGAHNQRAICLAKLRRMPDAVEDIKQAVRIVPKNVIFRLNLGLWTAQSGDFDGAEKEIRAIAEPDFHALAVLALSQVGRGLLHDAEETYRKIGTTGPWGASYAAAGLGDLAAYEGRYADAARIFTDGVAADVAVKNLDDAATKLTSLGNVEVVRGRRSAAIAAAENAVRYSRSAPVRFLAARVIVQAGALDKALELAMGLSTELPIEPQAYGKIVEGEIALKNGNARDAVKLLTDANAIVDTWLGRFDLGRAFFDAGAFAQADSEFDRCLTRRGEALSLMGADPTYEYFPAAYYYEGRIRETLRTDGFADLYREYLKARGKSTEDPLVPEIRTRAGQ
jgi:serine/threonine protein kinase/tetratricopeptide (TPR) repeat protein